MSKEGSLPTVSSTTSRSNSAQSPTYFVRQQTRELASFIDALFRGKTQYATETHIAPVARVEQMALVTLTLHFATQFEQTHPHFVAQSIRYYQETLSTLVRKTDIQFAQESTLHFILLGADQQGGKIVQERLWDTLLWHTLNTQEQEILRPCSLTIGHSSCSVRQPDIAGCIQEAASASHTFEQTIDTLPDLTLAPERETEPLAMIQTAHTEEIPRSEDGDCYLRARQLGIPYLPSLPLNVPEKVRQMCSVSMAHELQCYPLGRERNVLTVALADPGDKHILARLQQETGLHIFPVMAPLHELQRVLAYLV